MPVDCNTIDYDFRTTELVYDFSGPDVVKINAKFFYEKKHDEQQLEQSERNLDEISNFDLGDDEEIPDFEQEVRLGLSDHSDVEIETPQPLKLYGFKIKPDRIQVTLNGRVLDKAEYTILINGITTRQTLVIPTSDLNGIVEISNVLHTRDGVVGLMDDGEETTKVMFRNHDLGLTALVFSPDPKRNFSTYKTTVVLPESGPYSNPKVLCVNGNLIDYPENDKALASAASQKVYYDDTPKPSVALTFFMSNQYFLATGVGGVRHSLKWQTNNRSMNLNIYLKQKDFDINPHCFLAVRILQNVLLWNEKNFGETLPYQDFNVIASDDFQALGSNSNINFMMPYIITANTLMAKDQSLFNLVEMIARSVLMHGLAYPSRNCDFIGCAKLYLYLKYRLGDLYSTNYEQKLQAAVKSSNLSLEQQYTNLSFLVYTELGRNEFVAAVKFHAQNYPYDYSFDAVKQSLNRFCEPTNRKKINFLEIFSESSEVPTLLVRDSYDREGYKIIINLMYDPKGDAVSIVNYLDFSFELLDHNGKQIFYKKYLLTDFTNKIEIGFSKSQVTRKPTLVIDKSNLLANVIDCKSLEEQMHVFKSKNLFAKQYIWEQIKEKAIMEMQTQYSNNKKVEVPEYFLELYQHLLDCELNTAQKARMMLLPSKLHELLNHYCQSNIPSMLEVLRVLNNTVARRFADKFRKLAVEHEVVPGQRASYTPPVISKRAMQNAALTMLMRAPQSRDIQYCMQQVAFCGKPGVDNQTYMQSMQSLACAGYLLLTSDYENKDDFSEKFLQDFYANTACVDKAPFCLDILFSLYGSSNANSAFKLHESMRQLKGADGVLVFDINNPSHVSSFLESFTNNTLFHSLDGRGYNLLKSYIIELDQSGHTELATEFLQLFNMWLRSDPSDDTGPIRRHLIQNALHGVTKAKVSESCFNKARGYLFSIPASSITPAFEGFAPRRPLKLLLSQKINDGAKKGSAVLKSSA